MVIPVPSGVIMAVNIRKNKSAWRILPVQNFGEIMPMPERIIMNMGRRNIIPVTSMRDSTEPINSPREKKETAASVSAKGYNNLNVAGIIK